MTVAITGAEGAYILRIPEPVPEPIPERMETFEALQILASNIHASTPISQDQDQDQDRGTGGLYAWVEDVLGNQASST